MCHPIFWAGGFDLTSTLDLGYVCMRQAVVDAGGKLPSIFRGWPVKNGCTLSSMTTAIFWDTTCTETIVLLFTKEKKIDVKNGNVQVVCTYFQSKFWYNREFSLCYVDKLVQIWFLSLPWQRLDISIFLRDFFVVKQYVPHPNLSGSHVCTQRNFHHVQAKKSYNEKWFLSELPLCRVLPVLTPQFSPMRMMHLEIAKL